MKCKSFSDRFHFYDISYNSYIFSSISAIAPLLPKLLAASHWPQQFQSLFLLRYLQALTQQFYIQIRQQHTPRSAIVTVQFQLINRKNSIFPKPNFRDIKSPIIFQLVDISAGKNNIWGGWQWSYSLSHGWSFCF